MLSGKPIPKQRRATLQHLNVPLEVVPRARRLDLGPVLVFYSGGQRQRLVDGGVSLHHSFSPLDGLGIRACRRGHAICQEDMPACDLFGVFVREGFQLLVEPGLLRIICGSLEESPRHMDEGSLGHHVHTVHGVVLANNGCATVGLFDAPCGPMHMGQQFHTFH